MPGPETIVGIGYLPDAQTTPEGSSGTFPGQFHQAVIEVASRHGIELQPPLLTGSEEEVPQNPFELKTLLKDQVERAEILVVDLAALPCEEGIGLGMLVEMADTLGKSAVVFCSQETYQRFHAVRMGKAFLGTQRILEFIPHNGDYGPAIEAFDEVLTQFRKRHSP